MCAHFVSLSVLLQINIKIQSCPVFLMQRVYLQNRGTVRESYQKFYLHITHTNTEILQLWNILRRLRVLSTDSTEIATILVNIFQLSSLISLLTGGVCWTKILAGYGKFFFRSISSRHLALTSATDSSQQKMYALPENV